MWNRTAICLTLLLLSPAAYAAGEAIDWPSCVKEAAANNPTLMSARHAAEHAGFQVDVSKAAMLPQISGTAGVTHDAGELAPGRASASQAAPGGSSSPWSAVDQYSYGVQLKQSLYAGSRDEATVAAREATWAGARATIDKTSVQLAYDLHSAYIQLVYAQKLTALQADVATRRGENVRLVELRFEGGREDKGSVLKSRALANQANAERLQALRQLRVAQDQLSHLLGRASATAFVAKDELNLPSVPPEPKFAELSALTPAHREAEAAVLAAAAQLRAAHGENRPDLAATASALRVGDSWPPPANQFAIGLSLTVPIYSGGSDTADVRSAAAEEARLLGVSYASDLQTRSDMQQAFVALQNGVANVGLADEFLNASELQAEIARNQYSLGLVTFQQWDLTESGLIDAQRSLLATKRDAELAGASWHKALGSTLAEVLR